MTNLLLTHRNQKTIQLLINRYLHTLGYNSSHLGTLYISEILLILLNAKYEKCPILTKTIYPIIAAKHHSTIHNVKCTITLATKYMNSKNTLSQKQKFNTFRVDNYINTKSVINYILKKTAIISK